MIKKDMRVALVIPARMGSSRLYGKPLKDINGKSMIVRTVEQALKSSLGDVVVACCEQEVYDEVESKTLARAVLTDVDLASGSDRIWQCAQKLGLDKNCDILVNLQGDLPLISPDVIGMVLEPFIAYSDCEVSTLGCVSDDVSEVGNRNVVKIVSSLLEDTEDGDIGRAIYFSRCGIPYGINHIMHHIGIYAYRVEALKKFVALPRGKLEMQEELEQLRLIENNIPVYFRCVKTIPFGVDTEEDLQRAIDISKNNMDS